jgi:hypothetical protein
MLQIKTNATAVITRLDLEKYNSCKIWLEEHVSGVGGLVGVDK